MSGKIMGYEKHVIATGYDPNFAKLMEQALEDEGYKMHNISPQHVVREAYALKNHGKVVVVTEYKFNGHDTIGPEVASTARKANVPVVCVTGYSWDKIGDGMFDRVYTKHSGMFERSEFWNMMEEAFEKKAE